MILKVLDVKRMKSQFICYQESCFPIQCCNFYKDCVVAYYPDDSGESVTIPNGEWSLIEQDVIVDTMTLDERNSFEEKMRELRYLSIRIAKRTFTGTKFPEQPFEIPDDELVHYASDWIHTAFSGLKLIPARQAEALVFAQGREKNAPLHPQAYEALMEMDGAILPYNQPSYNYNLMEIVVPRKIRADEIYKIIMPPGNAKSWQNHWEYEQDWFD